MCRSAASSGATDGSSRPLTHSARSLICIAHASAMLIPLIFDDRAASLSRVPPQSGQAVKVIARSTNARMCGCIASTSFDRNDFWIVRDQPRIGEVDALDLDLGRLLVEEVLELLLGVLADRLVGIEVAAAAEDAAVPTVHAVARDRQRTLVERLAVVVERGEVEVGDRAHAFATRAHATGAAERPLLPRLAAGFLDRDRPGAADRRGVEGERVAVSRCAACRVG